ncbi:hypothetical protein JHK82_019041 [Glycine max]|nr:hypothetical protein JHK85_019483 [Glycine max]KAG5038223.1 hypothetical protein JHK86_019063 [Glycine max]KAG5143346.1 hypothetical protein JHK82_019041 [Glycine max]
MGVKMWQSIISFHEELLKLLRFWSNQLSNVFQQRFPFVEALKGWVKSTQFLERQSNHVSKMPPSKTLASLFLHSSQFPIQPTPPPQAHTLVQNFFTPHYKCLTLHILIRFKLYRIAHSLVADLTSTLPDPTDVALFHHLRDSFHLCSSNSSSAVFNLVIKSLTRLSLVPNALTILHLANCHGFTPTILSYNAVLDVHRTIIASTTPNECSTTWFGMACR